MHFLLYLSAIFVLTQNALAVNQFRRPAAEGPTGDYSENPVYEVGKDITFLWDTDFDMIDLVVWSDASDKLKTSLYKRITTNLSSKAFTWRPSFDGFPAESMTLGVFYLTFYQAGTTKQAAQSHYFNITQSATAAVASSSVEPSSTTPTSTNTAVSGSSTSATPASSPTATSTKTVSQSASEGLGAGAAAGIAVGATLGTILIVCAVGIVTWKRYQGRKRLGVQDRMSRGSLAWDNGYPAQYSNPAQYEHSTEWKSAMPVTPAELSNDRPAELGTGRG
ncbi:uncharacterized protein CTRU02_203955 [Colletotrichum truncatum]|uniref:Uncharacterized protein n=1 Tax=Colletotrichum truncatum TaxID=5467 RepID=A0ACC3ZAM8_COLTU|nr:uncharacterized protein CTRU02_15436 [Colletotrichum truncatum]KAF6781035.1 hypothetical protein CTRU02_15436 [Colletotrichum truncatum]